MQMYISVHGRLGAAAVMCVNLFKFY